MHYYTFNIGDYRRDTTHLSLLEHGIYRQLIDTYYLSEQPLCGDLATLMRTHCIRTADEQRALENVLQDFFQLQADGYHHTGCEKVLAQYHIKSDKARASAKARWGKEAEDMRTHSERNANGMLTNNHKPITNNHKPVKDNKRRQAALSCPAGVDQQVWDDFLATRKAAKAPVTETAIRGIEREAAKAGIALEAALQECTIRGWRGFKAEWVQGRSYNINKQEALEARNKRVGDEWLKKMEIEENADI